MRNKRRVRVVPASVVDCVWLQGLAEGAVRRGRLPICELLAQLALALRGTLQLLAGRRATPVAFSGGAPQSTGP